MKVALLQFNSLVGGVAQNLEKISKKIREISSVADLLVLPELALLGYPPKDLLALPHYLAAEEAALMDLAKLSGELKMGILVSHCERSVEAPKGLWNSATLFDKGQNLGSVRKSRLPFYDIFEEERFFSPYEKTQSNIFFRGKQLGIYICEDAWDDFLGFGKNDRRHHPTHNSSIARLKEADLIINLSASPFCVGKSFQRHELFQKTAKLLGKPLLYINSWGAQDDIIFDGRSFAVDSEGQLIAEAKAFAEDVLMVKPFEKNPAAEIQVPERWTEISDALILGVRDYAQKSGFKKIILGMSGGIDSALVCWIAAKALGPKNVIAVSMPTQFNSAETRSDAASISKNLRVEFREIPIQDSVDLYAKTLQIPNSGLTFENLQSRVRGTILMALSNESGALLLACGNKSELAMGYATLYGDMCGGLLPIGDLFKTDVFGLCRWINQQLNQQKNQLDNLAPFPDSIITRPPSAELAPGQKDSDSLPDYSILDAYLEDFIEDQGRHAIEWKNFPDPKTNGHDLYKKFARQEFKRRQAAPILKVRTRSFGSGWHMPLAKSDGIPPKGNG